jgi:3-hydroxy-3-methylglutaryl CoA synthase
MVKDEMGLNPKRDSSAWAALHPGERKKIQKAVQAKVDRLNAKQKQKEVVPIEELKVGAWYTGDSWCTHVAMWDGECFLSFRGKDVVLFGYGAASNAFSPHGEIRK